MARYYWDKEQNKLVCIDPGVGRGNPDVYFKQPYFDEHITNPSDPKTWGGMWVMSKRHKAEILKKHNLREAGDRIHGSSSFDKVSHRFAQESLRRKYE